MTVTEARKPHGNAGAIKPHKVQRARNAALQQPFYQHMGPPESDKKPWHPRDAAWEPLPGTTPVMLIDVEGCRWPVSTEGPALFCNAPKTTGSWCAHHDAMSKPKRTEEGATACVPTKLSKGQRKP